MAEHLLKGGNKKAKKRKTNGLDKNVWGSRRWRNNKLARGRERNRENEGKNEKHSQCNGPEIQKRRAKIDKSQYCKEYKERKS